MFMLSASERARLSATERLALIDRLWAGPGDAELPLTAPQAAELRRRQASFAAELADAQPWDQGQADLARDLARHPLMPAPYRVVVLPMARADIRDPQAWPLRR